MTSVIWPSGLMVIIGSRRLRAGCASTERFPTASLPCADGTVEGLRNHGNGDSGECEDRQADLVAGLGHADSVRIQEEIGSGGSRQQRGQNSWPQAAQHGRQKRHGVKGDVGRPGAERPVQGLAQKRGDHNQQDRPAITQGPRPVRRELLEEPPLHDGILCVRTGRRRTIAPLRAGAHDGWRQDRERHRGRQRSVGVEIMWHQDEIQQVGQRDQPGGKGKNLARPDPVERGPTQKNQRQPKEVNIQGVHWRHQPQGDAADRFLRAIRK